MGWTISIAGGRALATGRDKQEVRSGARVLRDKGYSRIGPILQSQITGDYYQWFKNESLAAAFYARYPQVKALEGTTEEE